MPPTASLSLAQDGAFNAFANFGLSLTNYTPAHTALQYIFLVTSIKENANSQMHA